MVFYSSIILQHFHSFTEQYWQQPFAGPCPQADESNPHPRTPFPSDRFNPAFPSTSVFSTWSLDFRFTDHNFIRMLSSLLCVLHIIPITASLILAAKCLVGRCLRIVTLLGVGFHAVSSASCHFPSLQTFKQKSTNPNITNMRKHIHLQYRNRFFRVVTKSKRRQNHPQWTYIYTYTHIQVIFLLFPLVGPMLVVLKLISPRPLSQPTLALQLNNTSA